MNTKFSIVIIFFLSTNLLFSAPLPTGMYIFKAKGTNKIIKYDLRKGFFVVTEAESKYVYQHTFELDATNDGYYIVRCLVGGNDNNSFYLNTNTNKFNYEYQESLDNVTFSNINKTGAEYQFRFIEVQGGYIIKNKGRPGEYLSYNSREGNLRMKTTIDNSFTIWEPLILEKHEDVYVQIDLKGHLGPDEGKFNNNDCYRMQGEVSVTMHSYSLYNPYFFPEKFISDLTPVQGRLQLLDFKGNRTTDFEFRFPNNGKFDDYWYSSRYYVRSDELLKNRIYLKIKGDIKGCHKSGNLSLDYNCDYKLIPHFYARISQDFLPIDGPPTPSENLPDGVVIGKYIFEALLTDGSELIDYFIIKSPRRVNDEGLVLGRWINQYTPKIFIAKENIETTFVHRTGQVDHTEKRIYYSGHNISGFLSIDIDY